MGNRFYDHLKDLISVLQHGFLPNRSCVTQLLSVLHTVGQSLDNNIQSDMIYLDFAKAFDTRSQHSQRSSGKSEALRWKRSTVLLVQGLPNWPYTKGGSWECSFSLVSCNLWPSAGEHFRPPVVHFVHKWSARQSCLRREGCTLRRRHQAIPKCRVCRRLWPHTRHSLICTSGCSAIILDLIRVNVKYCD